MIEEKVLKNVKKKFKFFITKATVTWLVMLAKQTGISKF